MAPSLPHTLHAQYPSHRLMHLAVIPDPPAMEARTLSSPYWAGLTTSSNGNTSTPRYGVATSVTSPTLR